MTKGTKLTPRSLVFVGPEEVVTTFEVEHPSTLGNRTGGRAPQDATIIKGYPSLYALETCETLQMGTLPYYRKQGDSLIWDLGSGIWDLGSGRGCHRGRRANRTPPRRPSRPRRIQQTDIELSVSHPLGRALGPKTTERLDVNETSQASLLVGDNCLIWCSSLEPQTAEEWSLSWDSLEPDYDHPTFLGEPAPFARALALMASSQRDLLGSYLDLRHRETGHVEQCSNLAVFYGPVVYLDDQRDYIL